MDRIEAMRVFARVFERRSFTQAAIDLNMPRSTVTDVIKRLENKLGAVLLARTTRQVAPTVEGDMFYQRCLSIIQSVEDVENIFSADTPKGRLRVDVHGSLARHFLIPKLPLFLAQYPDIELFISEGDRLSDAISEGIDCIVRVGTISTEELVALPLATLEEVTVAAPKYLQTYGTPQTIEDLSMHKMIGFQATHSSVPMPLEFVVNEKTINKSIAVALTVNAAETLIATAKLGLGIIQVPRYHIQQELDAGTLIPILTASPPAPFVVSLLYPQNRQYVARVNVYINWVCRIFNTL